MEQSSNIRVFKNTAFLYIRMVVVMVLNIFTSRLVLDALGVDDYGLYTVVGGIVMLFAIINNALSSGTSRFITFELGKGNFERLQNTFSASFIIHLFVAGIVCLLAETIGLWYVNTYLVVATDRVFAANCVYQFSIVTCMFSLTQVPYSASIIAHENMSIYAWVGIIEAMFKLIIVLFLLNVSSGDKLILYGLLLMVWSICMQCYYRFYCGKHYKESRLIWVRDKAYYKQLLSFSLWDVIGAFTVNGYSQGVNMLMNYFFGLAINAAKGISYQVEHVVNMFSNNFLTAVRPQIVKLFAEGNLEKMRKYIVEASKISYFLLLFVVVPLSIEVDYILTIWLKEVPEKTNLFLVLVLVYSLMRAFARPVVDGVHASGNIKQLNLYGGGMSVCLNLPLTYIVYRMGAPAEATFYVLILSTLVCNYIELYCLKKEIGFNIFRYSLNVYVRCILISIPSLLICLFLKSIMVESFLRVILVTITSTITIGLFVWLLGLSKPIKKEISVIILSKIKNEWKKQ